VPLIAPGTVLSDRYVIGRVLGGGGMGDVYEAVQRGLSRRVAIKLLKPELARNPEMLSRFRLEAEAAAALGHPNIVQVTDLCVVPGEAPYLVMEHLDGKSLHDIIATEGRLAPERASFIALQVLSALAAAHTAGIVHRDIKPANIFVVQTLAQDIVKLLDFGVAKLLEPQAGGPLTQVGEVLGTTSYMAPEQALGVPVDARADLFAVGAVLFHALSGELARPATDVEAAAWHRIRKLAEDAPWIDARLASVVDRAMHRDPAGRWASAEEMARELRPFVPRAGIFEETVRDHGGRFDTTSRDSMSPSSMTEPMFDNPLMARTPLMTSSSPEAKRPATAPMPARISHVPPTVLDQAPLRDSRQPPPMNYPRPSYPAPASSERLPMPPISTPRMSGIPPQQSSSGAAIAIVIGLVGLLALGAGAYWFFGVRPEGAIAARKQALLASVTGCPKPSTCTGTLQIDGPVNVCVPEAHAPVAGDVVVVDRGGAQALGQIEDVSSGGIFSLRELNGALTTASKSDIRGRVCR
jgi:serine/threonine-protein kinase